MNAETSEVLRVEDLVVRFEGRAQGLRRRREATHAVNGVSLTIRAGETLALVGESGSGKSTLGKAVMRLINASSGRIVFEGTDLRELSSRRLRPIRRRLQYVFQDPMAALPSRMTADRIVREPLDIHAIGTLATRRRRVEELFDLVGLRRELMSRYPHEFSGGQRQRIGIARALALEPSLLILDEPVSALDVSVQAQVVNLLRDIQERLGTAYLFIAHDLAVVRHLADRVAVMYLGKILEEGPARSVLERPTHPYTQALLAAVPITDPRLRGITSHRPLRGELPSPIHVPSGCVFRTRCPIARERCAQETPSLETHRDTEALVACHFGQEQAPFADLSVRRPS